MVLTPRQALLTALSCGLFLVGLFVTHFFIQAVPPVWIFAALSLNALIISAVEVFRARLPFTGAILIATALFYFFVNIAVPQ